MALGLALAAAAPLVCLNGAVAFFGSSFVFPLSPFFLREKARALSLYAGHRARCLVVRPDAPLEPLVLAAERRHALPPGLLASLVEVESRTRAHRISAAGAMGPAQLTAATAASLGVQDPFEPGASVDAGARYLASHLRHFRDVRLAVAAYNAGPGAITEGRVPRNGETEHYVARVMAEYERRRPAPSASAPRQASKAR